MSMASSRPLLVLASRRRAADVAEPLLARRLHPSDVSFVAAIVLWVVALAGTRPDAMDDWGLLRALPVTFFVAVGLLMLSIGDRKSVV